MRLIDADAFEKFIKEKYKDGESTDDIKDQMLFDLSYQPTAYDVEKVIADVDDFGDSCYQCQEDCRTKGCLVERIKNVIRNGGKE